MHLLLRHVPLPVPVLHGVPRGMGTPTERAWRAFVWCSTLVARAVLPAPNAGTRRQKQADATSLGLTSADARAAK